MRVDLHGTDWGLENMYLLANSSEMAFGTLLGVKPSSLVLI